ncbi:alpha-2B adrenergic receptor isoform X2 [Folsomia candida]|uniref:alpha-2B adrenergic receptor isoform X2 n=1 Tax=Folsomia candida TaxID=158441 RepID=UPI001604E65D|nr:alpha-2B adrenergic receptor isoform X2 [Folsomia candida]
MVSLNNHLFDMANITSRFYEEGYAAAGDSDHHHPNAPNFLNNLNLSWETENKYYNVNLDEFSTEMGSPSDPFPTPGDTTASLGWGDLALVSLFCSIIAGTVAGNTLVIAAVITTRRLRTVTNCFVMSLAVADWLVGVFVMPPKVALYLVHNKWKLGGFFCELWIALDILLCTASILSLCAISIDRYLAITRPLAYSRRRRSKRLALSMISCVWVAAAIITSPPILGWYDETRNVENNCQYNDNTGYVLYSALGSFFLPLLVMLYVYARIACVIARRQHSIQRLSNSSDKKSHCCGGSEVEEPLRGKESFSRRDIGTNNEMITKYHDQEQPRSPGVDKEMGEPLRPQPSVEPTVSGDTASSKWWGLFHLRSCTSSGDDDSQSGNGTKRSSSGGQKSGVGSSDSDSASGLALSLPDPATLSGGGGVIAESVIDEGNTLGPTRSGCSSPRCCGQSGCTNQTPNLHQPMSRTRTGSRLCHHSIATTSPQRSIHRVHQTTSSATRLYLDHELVPLDESKSLTISKSAPRVWTVEETTSNASLVVGSSGSRHKSPNGRTASLKQDRNGRNAGRFNSNCGGTITQTTLSVPMNNSPAGNPASLMSCSPTAMGTGGVVGREPSPSHNSTGSSNRIYHPQQQPVSGGSHFHHNHTPNHMSSMMHRGRSIKLTLNVHGNDHNQNGSSIARDFASGRVASFKRETKTAQTLAAVVGGFIICWLPFFVAYVIGPFIPSEMIPEALMDALIWLGWSNSTINPCIYSFYSQDFRSAFWRLTIKKCGSLIGYHKNTGRRSPRRYDDHNNTHSRVSA